jgi:general secretion pathway protein E
VIAMIDNAEIVQGSDGALHIAPEGLALKYRWSRPDRPDQEVAKYDEVAAVEVSPNGRQVLVVFAGPRESWTLKGTVRPEAMWAKDSIERYMERAQARKQPLFESKVDVEQLRAAIAEMAGADSAQVPVLTDLLLAQAIHHGATDLHLQPSGESTLVRLRVDGQLVTVGEMPGDLGQRVVARLEVMARMKSFAAGIAQTGRLTVEADGRAVDVRLTALPTTDGVRLTARFFDPQRALVDLDALGFEPEALAAYREAIGQPGGCVVMTGPAGSGKTTTMYASLAELVEADPSRSISTVEEPVELGMLGVDQTEVNRSAGLDFAAALRTVLRQDPRVIMVGEIRDIETAEIAMQAALTGHLIFTTVHAPSGAGVLTRLLDLGLEPYVVASSVTMILAQRLVRVLCPDCREACELTADELAWLGGIAPTDREGWETCRAVGCSACGGSGYRGRTGIFEMVPVTAQMRSAIMDRRPMQELERLAAEASSGDLWQAGLAKVAAGETTVDELRAVLGKPER